MHNALIMHRFFQSLIKDLIMFQDTLLKNNFITNLESYKKVQEQRVTLKDISVKTINFVAKTNKVL